MRDQKTSVVLGAWVLSTWLKSIFLFLSFYLVDVSIRAAVIPSARAAYAEHGMVASVNPVATQAGVDALKSGGNAIDAAVAVALTLGVVDGNNSGIGGGCFRAHPAGGRVGDCD